MKTEKKELEEGKEYLFKIIKHVEQTHSSPFWILQDPFGSRHVLRSKHYTKYGFEPNKTIKVRIVYISCTGKVTLEPEHPVYKVDSVHKFKFIKHDYRINSAGEEEPVLIVEDIYGEEIAVFTNDECQVPESFQPDYLECKVTGLKNSSLILEVTDNPKNYKND